MVTQRSAPSSAGRPFEHPPRPGLLHVHWFRWSQEQDFANGSLYRCRCGVVRCGF